MFKITGTGHYLPKKILTNQDLEKMVDTTDEWIKERTGISERRIADENENNSDMAVKAAQEALINAKLKPEDIELLIVGTSTPDYSIPAMAPIIQYKLGCRLIPAFDINSVCTSFAYSFLVAIGLLRSGFYKNCLIIGSDLYSRILNWNDRTTCCIFGDGSGAAILEKDDNKKGILSHIFGCDGKDYNLINIPVSGTANPPHPDKTYKTEDYYFQMKGLDVYEFTITTVPQVINNLIDHAGITKNDIDWIILHQANIRIVESVSKRIKFPIEKFIVNLDKYGNTSSASIPIAMHEARMSGKIKDGDKILLIGFGGGLSWGGVIFEW